MKDHSWASSPAARKIMQGNRSKDTAPELAIRRAVHALGLRYRVAVRPLHGIRRSADLVFPRAKVAVFVDGCFWHGCPEHYREPASNIEFWRLKVATNRARDIETTELFRLSGWVVLRFWAHDDPMIAAEKIRQVVGQRRSHVANPHDRPDQGIDGAVR
ncbi:very short patch repair endonuclease [Arthrobacter sp. NPDC058288]|uniref:very short patch repair endonuclease n=1 Tax=Arthrobacter sp. NPDC058288 TaxID=3346424 RepID=UPI0036E2102D